MKMLDLLAAEVSPEQEAIWADGRKRWKAGQDAGEAGLPCPDGANQMAYKSGSARRRVKAGEIIGFVMRACECSACGSQNYEWRMGCRCWPNETWLKAVPGFTMTYGIQVEPGSDPDDPACAFMKMDRVIALATAGREVIDIMTGEAVPVDLPNPTDQPTLKD